MLRLAALFLVALLTAAPVAATTQWFIVRGEITSIPAGSTFWYPVGTKYELYYAYDPDVWEPRDCSSQSDTQGVYVSFDDIVGNGLGVPGYPNLGCPPDGSPPVGYPGEPESEPNAFLRAFRFEHPDWRYQIEPTDKYWHYQIGESYIVRECPGGVCLPPDPTEFWQPGAYRVLYENFRTWGVFPNDVTLGINVQCNSRVDHTGWLPGNPDLLPSDLANCQLGSVTNPNVPVVQFLVTGTVNAVSDARQVAGGVSWFEDDDFLYQTGEGSLYGGDYVGDGVDNCKRHFNMAHVGITPIGYQFPPDPNRTYTDGGHGPQLDDDGDGVGNRCDADYDNLGAVVTASDFNDMKASVGKVVNTSTCGVSETKNCKIFDHDGVGAVITAEDFNLSKELLGTVVSAQTCKPGCAQTCIGPDCP